MLKFALFVRVFGKMIRLAFRGAWKFMKTLCRIAFFPLMLIGWVFKKVFALLLPILLITGLAGLITSKSDS